jgi:hypothetical protein
MSALRERPRVVLARLFGVVVLLAIGFVLGGALKSDPAPKTPAPVQQQVRELKQDKRTLSAGLDRAERTQTRQARTNRDQARRLRAAAARERRLRRSLRRARR